MIVATPVEILIVRSNKVVQAGRRDLNDVICEL